MDLNFYAYRNSDYVRLASQVLLICQVYGVEVLQAIGIAASYQSLQERSTQISLALDKNGKNPMTPKVALADQVRDDDLDALKFFLMYCSKQKDLNIRAAALRVITVLKTIGWTMTRDSYSEQTKNVKSFIAEVEASSSLLADLQRCDAADLFEEVKASQATFDQVISDFNKQATLMKAIDPTVEKEWLRTTLTDIADDLTYHCRKGTNAECQLIYNQMETVVDSIAAEIKARATRSETEEEPETESEII